MAAAESATAIQRNQVDLLDFIDWSGVECLNQSSGHSLSNALKQGYREDEGFNLESDADEQLFIYISLSLKSSNYIPLTSRDPKRKGKSVALKCVKFQNVRSLTIFIEDNHSGSEITKVQKTALYGSTVETTDMKGLKKIEEH
ncbi:hypothetical protein GOBAR_DD11922 [Gossypium barbadense]|nr:hypothetical protein GOBAR_DD11922 [Gossypium barbadense]